MNSIQVAIVEDIAEIREGLRFIIQQTAGFNCQAVYANAEEALVGLSADPPDIAIMDIALPGDSGIACIRKLKQLNSPIQFLVFTIYEDSDQVFDALSAGANGYLLKNATPGKIIDALHELYSGGAPMSTLIARKVINSFHRSREGDSISAREMEILQLLAGGFLYKEIADKLYISTGTVKQHIHHIYEKLHVQNRTEAINKFFGKHR